VHESADSADVSALREIGAGYEKESGDTPAAVTWFAVRLDADYR
jgi:hypothetical protein